MPIAGNVELRFYVFITRNVLWKEGKEEDVCGRCSSRKIQIIMRWLGTGRVVKFAGQVVKSERLKVKFERLKVKFGLKGQRSVQQPKDD